TRGSTVALGKALGATLLGTTQAVVVAVLLLSLLRLWPGPSGLLLGFIAIVLSGLALGALGLLLAATIRSIENFAGVMNFVVFPMLFLSGALYPVRRLGPGLHVLVHANPLAYGGDLLKHALLAGCAGRSCRAELSSAAAVLRRAAARCRGRARPRSARASGTAPPLPRASRACCRRPRPSTPVRGCVAPRRKAPARRSAMRTRTRR